MRLYLINPSNPLVSIVRVKEKAAGTGTVFGNRSVSWFSRA